MNKRCLIWGIAALLLVSCGTAPPTPVPSPTATPIAELPTAVPTLPPATPTVVLAATLPAPVYLIQNDQVMRLEPDGNRLTQITYELQPVRELSVAENGTLVYLTGNELVALDGAGRRVVVNERAISHPRISPDGQQIAYHLDAPAPGFIIGREDSPSGVYLSHISAGRPSLLIADDPEPAEPDFTNPAWRYLPVAWSPTGAQLLLYAVMRPEMGIPGGEAVIIGLGDMVVRAFSCCEEELWSIDGSELTVAGGGPGPDIRFGLYRIDAGNGVEFPVLESSETTIPLVRAPQRLADGVIYAFVELVSVHDYSWEYPFRPQMVRVSDDGVITPVRPEQFDEPALVLWERQGRGAMVRFANSETLVWLPSDPRLPLLTTAAAGFAFTWVPAADLAARDCGLFTTLAPQIAADRRFDPAVADAQGRLAALGFNPGPIDGLFGPATAAAVRAFRVAAGLPADDRIDCVTWQALLARSIAP
ncbi:peptidoglycan-binding domain-containing protein [Chloroflexus sp.]|uniref:peptidoglycan-binding domain-containing protein n=1 Tax=Chloroflexus sp. TaxID=1904827 RepID=UPI00298EF136|nr:peptidoglycan-binding domain-containing protein [Chloroflexus sp.]MDW8405127.1 peptidoglycan-binding domain-containing protein [Chloroflexus sp.]